MLVGASGGEMGNTRRAKMSRKLRLVLGLMIATGACSSPAVDPFVDSSGESEDASPASSGATGTSNDSTGTSPADPECGNGLLESGEACDLGFANRDDGRCTSSCAWARCGDGHVGPGEDCDEPGTGRCTETCTVSSDVLWMHYVNGTADDDDEALEVQLGDDQRIYATGWLMHAEGTAAWLGAFEGDGSLRYEHAMPVGDCSWTRRNRLLVTPLGEVFFAVSSCQGDTTLTQILPDGTRGWSTELQTQSEISGALGGMDFHDGSIVASYFEVEGERRLGWIDRADGTLQREVSIEEELRDLEVAPDGTIVGLGRTHLAVYETDGTLSWRKTVRSIDYNPTFNHSLALDGNDSIVLARDAQDADTRGPIIERYDFDGTRLKWRTLLEEVPVPNDWVDVGRVTLGADGTAHVALQVPAEPGRPQSDTDALFLAYDRSLELRWSLRHRGSAGASDAGSDVVPVTDSELIVVGRESRALRGMDVFVGRLRTPPSAQDERQEVHRVVSGPNVRFGAEAERVDASEPGPDTVYVNVLGQRLEPGSNSALDQAQCVEGPFDYPPYTGRLEDAEAALTRARELLAPYAVRIVTERPPAHLPYMLVVVGGIAQDFGVDPGVRGLSCGIDCGAQARRDTVFVFGDSASNPEELGQIIVHEAAHRWGLEHVDAELDLMHPSSSRFRTEIRDECRPLHDPRNASCTDVHEVFCPEGTAQNAHAELLAALGPALATDASPTVEIVAPADDATLIAGDEVLVEVNVDDDHPNFGWSFEVPELQWSQPAFEGEHELHLRFPPGEYTVAVRASDQGGNETRATVRIQVVHPADAPDEPAVGASTSSSGSSTASTEASRDAVAGRGCAIGARRPATLVAGWLVMLLGRRRRAALIVSP